MHKPAFKDSTLYPANQRKIMQSQIELDIQSYSSWNYKLLTADGSIEAALIPFQSLVLYISFMAKGGCPIILVAAANDFLTEWSFVTLFFNFPELASVCVRYWFFIIHLRIFTATTPTASFTTQMPANFKVKSLKQSCQDSLTKCLDGKQYCRIEKIASCLTVRFYFCSLIWSGLCTIFPIEGLPQTCYTSTALSYRKCESSKFFK